LIYEKGKNFQFEHGIRIDEAIEYVSRKYLLNFVKMNQFVKPIILDYEKSILSKCSYPTAVRFTSFEMGFLFTIYASTYPFNEIEQSWK
jgi:hypothetical protein